MIELVPRSSIKKSVGPTAEIDLGRWMVIFGNNTPTQKPDAIAASANGVNNGHTDILILISIVLHLCVYHDKIQPESASTLVVSSGSPGNVPTTAYSAPAQDTERLLYTVIVMVTRIHDY